jgi:SAM-dependent methyltransferase
MGYQVTAADISSCSLAACQLNVSRQALHAVKLIQISAPDYYANIDGDFDVIVAKDVIEHIQDDVAFLRAMAGRLRADGCLVLVTQNDHSWNYVLEAPRELAKNPCWCGWHPTEHVRFYNKPRLKGLLWAVGLRPVAWRSVYLLPYQAFRGYFPRRARNFVHKLAGEAAFYWPDRILGGIWPFNGLGWSIQVKAVKADPCCHNSG